METFSIDGLRNRIDRFPEDGLADKMETIFLVQEQVCRSFLANEPNLLTVAFSRQIIKLLPQSFNRLFSGKYDVTWKDPDVVDLDQRNPEEVYELALQIAAPKEGRCASLVLTFDSNITIMPEGGASGFWVSLGFLDTFGDVKEIAYFIFERCPGVEAVNAIHEDIVGFLQQNEVPARYVPSTTNY